MKIAVYAGHGGSDSGAVGCGHKEKDLTLQVALKMTALYKAKGHTVINNRTADVDRYITNDANRANSEKVDLVQSIHLNSNSGTPGTGVEVYHSINGGTGQTLAAEICKGIAALGYTNRGPKTKTGTAGDYFGIIRQTSAPANLIEMCFINNQSDMNAFNADKMASAIVDATLNTMGGNTSGGSTSSGGSSSGSANTSVPSDTKSIQQWVKGEYKLNISVSGIYTAELHSALVIATQRELNKYGAGLAEDGIFGAKTKAACRVLSNGATGNLVRILQSYMCLLGYYTYVDGIFGADTGAKTGQLQAAYKITVDRKAGPDTFEKMFNDFTNMR